MGLKADGDGIAEAGLGIMELVELADTVRFFGMMAVPLLSSRLHMGMGSSGQDGSSQMACSWGPWDLTTVGVGYSGS